MNSTMTPQQFKLLMTQVSKFNTIASARSSAARCTKIQAILHGDDGLIWSTTPATAAKLERAGYEIIEYAH